MKLDDVEKNPMLRGAQVAMLEVEMEPSEPGRDGALRWTAPGISLAMTAQQHALLGRPGRVKVTIGYPEHAEVPEDNS